MIALFASVRPSDRPSTRLEDTSRRRIIHLITRPSTARASTASPSASCSHHRVRSRRRTCHPGGAGGVGASRTRHPLAAGRTRLRTSSSDDDDVVVMPAHGPTALLRRPGSAVGDVLRGGVELRRVAGELGACCQYKTGFSATRIKDNNPMCDAGTQRQARRPPHP